MQFDIIAKAHEITTSLFTVDAFGPRVSHAICAFLTEFIFEICCSVFMRMVCDAVLMLQVLAKEWPVGGSLCDIRMTRVL